MSVWPVTAWAITCDATGCTHTGPSRDTIAAALDAWTRTGGLARVEPVAEAAHDAWRYTLTLCPVHAVTVCARCGTRRDLVVTDTDARRSWCGPCWREAVDAAVPGAPPVSGRSPQGGAERPAGANLARLTGESDPTP